MSLPQRERDQLQVEISMVCKYIDILIGKMKGYRMSVPPVPHIPGRDTPISQHESKYIPTSLKPAGSQGYVLLDDWARGPIPGYVPGSPGDQASPSMVPTTSDYANDDNAERFINDFVRNDDYLQASHVLLYHDVAPA